MINKKISKRKIQAAKTKNNILKLLKDCSLNMELIMLV